MIGVGAVGPTSTTAATAAPKTATPVNLPTANFVSPFDGAVLPTGRPVEIVLAAGDATGLASLKLAIDGRNFAVYPIDGEKLYARTLNWDAPQEAGEVVFTVTAVNVDGVSGEPQTITVNFVAAVVDVTATITPTATPLPARATTATTGTTAAPAGVASATPAATVAPPTAAPANPVGPTTLLGFEAFGNWRRGDQANGEFTQSSEQSRSGFAAKYAYNFPGPDNDFVVFSQFHDVAGRPNALTLWVYGDNSGNYLNAWIIDAEGQAWSAPFGRIQHTGWQQMTARIDPEQGWPGGHVYGPDNGQIDYPIQFSSFVLDDAANDFVGQGTIYLDDLVVTTLEE